MLHLRVQVFFYRTSTPSSPILCTWNSSEFLNEIDKKHELREYGELSEIITYSFRAIVRETKKYHEWLVPKLNILMQMSPKSSHELPGLTYIDHTEVGLDFEQRFTMYFNRINHCMPRIIMVEYPKEKCKMIKHKEIVVVDETWQLKTVGIYRNGNHCDFVWSHVTRDCDSRLRTREN